MKKYLLLLSILIASSLQCQPSPKPPPRTTTTTTTTPSTTTTTTTTTSSTTSTSQSENYRPRQDYIYDYTYTNEDIENTDEEDFAVLPVVIAGSIGSVLILILIVVFTVVRRRNADNGEKPGEYYDKRDPEYVYEQDRVYDTRVYDENGEKRGNYDNYYDQGKNYYDGQKDYDKRVSSQDYDQDYQ